MDKAGNAGQRSLTVASELKKAMNQAIKESGLSRPQLADRMNELLQEEGIENEVTTDIINSWTKDDPKRLIPTALITFFCKATKSFLPIVAIGKVVGAMVIGGRDLDFLELGIAEFEKSQAQQREVRAWANLGLKPPPENYK
jgi:hypothetical protein